MKILMTIGVDTYFCRLHVCLDYTNCLPWVFRRMFHVLVFGNHSEAPSTGVQTGIEKKKKKKMKA